MHALKALVASLLLGASPAGATTTITQVATGASATLDMATDGANKWPAHLIWDGTTWATVNADGGLTAHVSNWPTSTAVTGTFWQTTQPVSGTFWQTTQPVSGTFWQTTQPVSLASLPALATGSNVVGKAGLLAHDASTSLDSAAGTPNGQAVTVQGNASGVPVPVAPQAQATGGRSSGVAASLTSPVVIKASAGTISAIHCDNTAGTTTAYAQILNTASSPALGTNVLWFVTMAGGQPGTIVFDSAGLAASTGISIGLATTPNGSTAYATAGNCAVEYK